MEQFHTELLHFWLLNSVIRLQPQFRKLLVIFLLGVFVMSSCEGDFCRVVKDSLVGINTLEVSSYSM